jgi:hypothetical protein
VSTSQLERETRSSEALERFLVKPFRGFSLAEQRARSRFDAERPLGAGRPSPLRQPVDRSVGHLGSAAACRGLDELR